MDQANRKMGHPDLAEKAAKAKRVEQDSKSDTCPPSRPNSPKTYSALPAEEYALPKSVDQAFESDDSCPPYSPNSPETYSALPAEESSDSSDSEESEDYEPVEYRFYSGNSDLFREYGPRVDFATQGNPYCYVAKRRRRPESHESNEGRKRCK